MNLNQFVREVILKEAKTEIDKAVLLCFYFDVNENKKLHTIKDLMLYFQQSGFSRPNSSRLNANIKKSRDFVKERDCFKLHIKTKDKLYKKYGELFEIKELESHNEILDAETFLDLKNLYPMIIEMNAAYHYGIFDGCEVLMRRIFEILLIMVYENFKIENLIKTNNGTYKNLSDIVKDAEKNSTINLSREKFNYKKFVEQFNTSAHNRYYMATKPAIDEIKHKYRVAITELYFKAKENIKNGKI